MKIEKFPFAGEWFEAFGAPQSTGIWYVYGESGSGKTTFILNLVKCLSQYCNSVLFESHEEGESSVALQDGICRLGLLDVKNIFVVDESREEMIERMNMRKSSSVVLIDSLEHSEFKEIKQVIELKKLFPKKLFIFTGQASGDKPRSTLGESVLFLANQKIKVEGYRAICRGRSMGTKGYFTIWEEGANKYWEK
jgi:GTPase SAR1 family protein